MIGCRGSASLTCFAWGRNYDVILGMPWFRSYQPHADFARHVLWVRIGKELVRISCEQTTKEDLASAKLPPPPGSCQTESVKPGEDILSFGELQTMLRHGQEVFVVYTRDPKDGTDECLVHPLAKRIVHGEFKDVFPDEVPSGLPPIRLHDHRFWWRKVLNLTLGRPIISLRRRRRKHRIRSKSGSPKAGSDPAEARGACRSSLLQRRMAS